MTPQDIQRAESIRAEIWATKGFRLEQQMLSIGRMSEMVGRNHAELRVSVRAIADPRLGFPRQNGNDRRQDDDLLEVARRLDNFLASAISRVERTSFMAASLRDVDPALKHDHKSRLSALRRDPLFRLVEYLRDHSIHVSFHGLQARLTIRASTEGRATLGGTPCAVTARVFVVKPKPRESRTRRARDQTALLSGYPQELEVEKLTREFCSLTDGLLNWYLSRLASLRATFAAPLDELRSELQDILAR